MRENIQKMLSNYIENIKNTIQSENVIAKPIFIDDKTYIIPISKITVGFASGGGEYGQMQEDENLPFAGGGGGGLSITPVGMLIGSGGKHNYVKLNGKDSDNKWLDLISAMINLTKK